MLTVYFFHLKFNAPLTLKDSRAEALLSTSTKYDAGLRGVV